MCVTTTVVSSYCQCKSVRYFYCNAREYLANNLPHTKNANNSHFLDKEHTHKQIDNEPCPKHQYLFVEIPKDGCGGETDDTEDEDGESLDCLEYVDEQYVFEHLDRRLHDFAFLEPKGDLFAMEPDCLYLEDHTMKHTCGMEKGARYPFRHLNEV